MPGDKFSTIDLTDAYYHIQIYDVTVLCVPDAAV